MRRPGRKVDRASTGNTLGADRMQYKGIRFANNPDVLRITAPCHGACTIVVRGFLLPGMETEADVRLD